MKQAKVELTKKLENNGWTQNDVDMVNAIASKYEGIAYETLKNSSKVTITRNGIKIATVFPVRLFSGEDGYDVIYDGIEHEYISLKRAINTVCKRIEKKF